MALHLSPCSLLCGTSIYHHDAPQDKHKGHDRMHAVDLKNMDTKDWSRVHARRLQATVHGERSNTLRWYVICCVLHVHRISLSPWFFIFRQNASSVDLHTVALIQCPFKRVLRSQVVEPCVDLSDGCTRMQLHARLARHRIAHLERISSSSSCCCRTDACIYTGDTDVWSINWPVWALPWRRRPTRRPATRLEHIYIRMAICTCAIQPRSVGRPVARRARHWPGARLRMTINNRRPLDLGPATGAARLFDALSRLCCCIHRVELLYEVTPEIFARGRLMLN